MSSKAILNIVGATIAVLGSAALELLYVRGETPRPILLDIDHPKLKFVPTDRIAEMTRDGVLTLFADSKAYAVVHPDGRVEYLNGCTPDEAAKAFWRMVEFLYLQHARELLRKTNA